MSNVINSPAYAFTFGALNLIGSDAELAANGYRFWVLDEDGDLGTPEAIEQTIISWLQDGAIVDLTGYGNRELLLRVMVEGNSGLNLALGEAALMLQTGKTNTLTYRSADATAPVSVFSVVTSKLEPVTQPAAERTNESSYGLRITAEPFVRSVGLVAVTNAAPTGTQTITSIDACTSTTNWTKEVQIFPGSNVSSAASTDGARVYGTVTNTAYPRDIRLGIKRSSLAVSLSGTPYIRVLLSSSSSGLILSPPYAAEYSLNGVLVTPAAQYGNVIWFDASAYGITTLTSLQVLLAMTTTSATNTVTLGVDDVSRSNVLGEQATNRQLARIIPVVGSARTQGNLVLEDTTNALGSALVHTMPVVSGMVQPNLGALLATGNTRTGDSTTVSGFTSDLSALHGFDVPVSGLVAGGHLLLARIKHASSGSRTLTWAAKSRQGTTSLPGGQSGTTSVNLPVGGAYSIVTVARLTLPPRKLGSNGTVRIELTAPSGVTFDEAWIFNIEAGRLTKIECGTASPSAGGSANRLFLDSPSLASPVPAVYLGTAADRSDSFHAADELESFTVHEFLPGSMNVFTVTTNSTAASVTLSHYPRWLTRAAA